MQNSRPGYQNRSGGNSKPGDYNNHNYNNNYYYNRAPPRAPNNNNNNNTNTAPRTGSNAVPVANKQDKTTITCYECGVVGHYSNECPKRLAKLAGNTAAPAQQQRRVSTGKKFAPNNPNNRNGRLYHMNAEEAQEAPDVVLETLGRGRARLGHGHAGHVANPTPSPLSIASPTWPWCPASPPRLSTSPSTHQLAVAAVESPETARPERASMPFVSRVARHRRALDTRRPTPSRQPWTPCEHVERHRATTNAPDTLAKPTRARRRRRRKP
ncbi:hypothetical protein QYE76_061471 [Lolium multiflorum]|uniref:CCHC-type domain-containing protein n=1 Tax=Lolium multiflorum TaxID=4521 RepID=A0AAD8W4R2_LOLMU|nr:hypothetical protein QYE76_061471 [Lolium multiflorum]